jgi:hypothetical protein
VERTFPRASDPSSTPALTARTGPAAVLNAAFVDQSRALCRRPAASSAPADRGVDQTTQGVFVGEREHFTVMRQRAVSNALTPSAAGPGDCQSGRALRGCVSSGTGAAVSRPQRHFEMIVRSERTPAIPLRSKNRRSRHDAGPPTHCRRPHVRPCTATCPAGRARTMGNDHRSCLVRRAPLLVARTRRALTTRTGVSAGVGSRRDTFRLVASSVSQSASAAAVTVRAASAHACLAR